MEGRIGARHGGHRLPSLQHGQLLPAGVTGMACKEIDIPGGYLKSYSILQDRDQTLIL